MRVFVSAEAVLLSGTAVFGVRVTIREMRSLCVTASDAADRREGVRAAVSRAAVLREAVVVRDREEEARIRSYRLRDEDEDVALALSFDSARAAEGPSMTRRRRLDARLSVLSVPDVLPRMRWRRRDARLWVVLEDTDERDDGVIVRDTVDGVDRAAVEAVLERRADVAVRLERVRSATSTVRLTRRAGVTLRRDGVRDADERAARVADEEAVDVCRRGAAAADADRAERLLEREARDAAADAVADRLGWAAADRCRAGAAAFCLADALADLLLVCGRERA